MNYNNEQLIKENRSMNTKIERLNSTIECLNFTNEQLVEENRGLATQVEHMSDLFSGLPAYHYAIEKWSEPLKKEFPEGFVILGAQFDDAGKSKNFFLETGDFFSNRFLIDWQKIRIWKPEKQSIGIWLPPYRSTPPQYIDWPNGFMFKMDHSEEGHWVSTNVSGYYLKVSVVETFARFTTLAIGIKKGRHTNLEDKNVEIRWMGGFMSSADESKNIDSTEK